MCRDISTCTLKPSPQIESCVKSIDHCLKYIFVVPTKKKKKLPQQMLLTNNSSNPKKRLFYRSEEAYYFEPEHTKNIKEKIGDEAKFFTQFIVLNK